jgi:hypothetical protein
MQRWLIAGCSSGLVFVLAWWAIRALEAPPPVPSPVVALPSVTPALPVPVPVPIPEQKWPALADAAVQLEVAEAPLESPYLGNSPELDYVESLLAAGDTNPEVLKSVRAVLTRCLDMHPGLPRCVAALRTLDAGRPTLAHPVDRERRPPLQLTPVGPKARMLEQLKKQP